MVHSNTSNTLAELQQMKALCNSHSPAAAAALEAGPQPGWIVKCSNTCFRSLHSLCSWHASRQRMLSSMTAAHAAFLHSRRTSRFVQLCLAWVPVAGAGAASPLVTATARCLPALRAPSWCLVPIGVANSCAMTQSCKSWDSQAGHRLIMTDEQLS